MKSLIVILLIAFPYFFLSCDTETMMGEVAGVIYYSGTDIPIPDVEVKVDARTVTSDEEGFYSLRNPLGKFYLTTEKEGFDSFETELKFIHGKIDLDIELTSSTFTGVVYGIISGNHTGKPIPDIRILLLNPDETESEIQSFSKNDGSYSLGGIPFGERMIIVVQDGIIIFQELILLNSISYELNVSLPESFEFVDSRDGHIYSALKIGTQTWMTENLAWLPKVTGPANGSYDEPNFYVYNYFGSNLVEVRSSPEYNNYGALYNLVAAKTACPKGWHLPSDSEWQTLEGFLGLGIFDIISDGARRVGDVGYKLKSKYGWVNNGNGDNSSKFNVLPVGIRFDRGEFDEYGLRAAMWTSTESSDVYAWGRGFGSTVSWVDRDRHNIQNGLSVRCISDF